MVKKVMGVAAVVLVLSLAACGDRDVVDGRAEVPTPEGGICHLLEIDRETVDGGEASESYFCVTPEEWEKNRVGEEWVDANGKRK